MSWTRISEPSTIPVFHVHTVDVIVLESNLQSSRNCLVLTRIFQPQICLKRILLSLEGVYQSCWTHVTYITHPVMISNILQYGWVKLKFDMYHQKWLGGGFNPSEKYDRQIGSFPQVEVNIKKIFETTAQMISFNSNWIFQELWGQFPSTFGLWRKKWQITWRMHLSLSLYIYACLNTYQPIYIYT